MRRRVLGQIEGVAIALPERVPLSVESVVYFVQLMNRHAPGKHRIDTCCKTLSWELALSPKIEDLSVGMNSGVSAACHPDTGGLLSDLVDGVLYRLLNGWAGLLALPADESCTVILDDGFEVAHGGRDNRGLGSAEGPRCGFLAHVSRKGCISGAGCAAVVNLNHQIFVRKCRFTLGVE